ncbi:hypothetical protein QQ045_016755 [Rhodiola kirilowii]
MPESRMFPDSNATAHNESSHNPHEAISQQMIQNKFKPDVYVTESGQYPDRPGEPNCTYYLRTGSCGYGSNCRYNHPTCVGQDAVYELEGEFPERDGEPDCGFFLKTGTCKYGSSCKYNHPRDRNGPNPVSFNILGLPMRPDENPCMYYMRTGQCKFGPTCKFHHPQSAAPGHVMSVYGTPLLGPSESLNVPISAFPALPIPAAAYIYDPRIQAPPAYMPMMAVSPSQGILPQHGWSTYPGSMRPISFANSHRSSPSYHSRSLGESSSNGQVHHLSFFTSPYPERPDRPECRYFLNSGTCKYGPNCKYNHPKERIAHQLSLSSPGFPFRPEQPLCSSYSTFGICGNGPMCKFHHQVGGFPLNYSLNPVPFPLPIPVFEEPLQRKSSTVVISYETSSPSKSVKDLEVVKKRDSATERTQQLGTDGQEKSHEEEETGTPRDSLPASNTEKHD